MRWGTEGGLDSSVSENLRPVHSQEEAGCWLWQVNKHFCFDWSWEQEGQLIIYEERTGNLRGLCLALAWRNKQASMRHIEGIWRRVVLWGQLLPGIRKGEKGFNHGFLFLFPQSHKSQASVKFNVIRVKTVSVETALEDEIQVKDSGQARC